MLHFVGKLIQRLCWNRIAIPCEPSFPFGLPFPGLWVWSFRTFYLRVALLEKLRAHPFRKEVVYVRDLRQVLNRIYRRERKLEAAAAAGDRDALIVLNFFSRGSKQRYELDDTLVTIDELVEKILYHDKRLAETGLTTAADAFDPAMRDTLN
mgnify:CR=1 FL=1